jgi:outer membrane receptor protein involved in Fe transport
MIYRSIFSALAASTCIVALATPAAAQTRSYDIPASDLPAALDRFAQQSGAQIVYKVDEVRGKRSKSVKGSYDTGEALRRLLAGSGFEARRDNSGAFAVVRVGNGQSDAEAASLGGDGIAETSEIIVTAQKREERLRDVPVPVSVLNANALAENNQNGLRDYFTRVPGLNLTVGNRGEAFIAIRGVTTTPFQNPTVGITVDDVPYGSTLITGGGLITPDIDPSDLSRIEVLRGPQGTLYGVSSLGGLVKYVTVDPSTAETSGRIQGGLFQIHGGDEFGYSIRGSLNLPASDTLALRLSAFHRSEPGYVRNVTTGQDDVNSGNAEGGMITTLWRPSSDFSLKLSALVQNRDVDGSGLIFRSPGLDDLEQTYLRGSGWYQTRFQAYNATAKIGIGAAELTSVTGYNISKIADSVDTSVFFSGLADLLFGVSGAPIEEHYRTRKFSQELRVAVPFGDNVDFLLGGFYTYERSRVLSSILATDTETGQTAGIIDQSLGTPTYRELAGFLTLTVRLSDVFDVQLGGRQSFNRLTYEAEASGIFYPDGSQITPRLAIKDEPFTYLVTPRLKLSSNLMLYARVASGYRAGGVNPNFALGQPAPPGWKPDTTRNYEIGAKGEFFGGALSFDASIYHIDWDDIHLQFVTPVTAYVTNGGTARSQGFEASLEARPAEGFRLATSFSWNHARLTEDLDPLTGLVGRSGDRLPFSSRFSGNIAADHDFALTGDATAFVGGTLTYVGARKGLFQAVAGARQTYPDYVQIDLRAGIDTGDWRANLYVNNLTDRRALLGGGVGAINPAAFSIIQPRTIGVSLTRSF